MGKKVLGKMLLLGLSVVVAFTAAGSVWAEKILTKAEALAAAKVELNNTSWEIELKPMVTGKKKAKKNEQDTLLFLNKQIVSDKLEAKGFSPSNYTIRIKGKDNEIVIWETMQASEDRGVAFWRGEIRKGKMRGVLSWHISDEKKENYNFVSLTTEVIPEEIEAPEPEPVAEEPAEKEFTEIPVE